MDKLITRRDRLIVPLVVAVPMALLATAASAGGPDPTMTIVKPPEQLTWTRNPRAPDFQSAGRGFKSRPQSVPSRSKRPDFYLTKFTRARDPFRTALE